MRNWAFGLVGVAVLLTIGAIWMQREPRAADTTADPADAAHVEKASSEGSGRGLLMGSSRDSEPGASSAGLLGRRGVPRASTAAQSAPAERASGPQDAAGGEAPAAEPTSPTLALRAEGAVRITPPPIGAELEAEIEVGAALFHLAPADFHAWMDGGGGFGLDADRRLLALAFSSALGGAQQDWGSVREKLAQSPAINGRELALFDRAVGRAGGAIPAAATRASALEIAMAMDLIHAEGEAALESHDYRRAAQSFSRALMEELSAPWESDVRALALLSDEVARAQKGHRWNRKGDWRSVAMRVEPGDSLVAIRKRFLEEHPDNVVCTGLIDRANGIEGRYLRAGDELRIPLDEVSVLVDLSAHWVFYRFGDEVAAAWPAGTGKSDSPTDTGEFVIGNKITDPVWYSPQGEIPFGDPRNELGTRWLGWDDDLGPTTLGFHGTNEPDTVGESVSRGCVRLTNADVEELFEIVPQGARVIVQE